jgi:hypothetical protein
VTTTRTTPRTTPRPPRRTAPILATAAIAAGLAGVALASGSTAQGATVASPRLETIRLVATDGGDEGSIDAKPKGDSIGDYFAFNTPLENLQGERVGRVDGYSVLTGTGAALASLHFVTLTLPGGQITTQNTELPSIEDGNGPEAITGGTGRYQGVGGQLTFEDEGHIVVLHLRR